ncbi:hypothetical protein ACIQBJ_30895 [Kitasatospora sp. NPDC088391]|uniref:hypothetical protein n=1 Tax=Kitasatospora sp. NPDC088391 TaxID=3364074 RepID=UPI00381F127A
MRSTWWVVAAALLLNAAVAGLSAHRAPEGEWAVAAVVPWLPLPITALAAAVLGALAYGHETRWPGLVAGRVALRRRLGALTAKLLVIGAVAVALAVLSLAVNAVVVRFALPTGADASTVFALPHPADLWHPSRLLRPGGPFGTGGAGRTLSAFVALAVAGGWAGLLLTSMVRSAVVGVLLTGALPALLEPTAGLLLHSRGLNWPVWVRELLPFQYGLELFRDGADRTAGALDGAVAAALLLPAGALVLAALLAQLRRRAL